MFVAVWFLPRVLIIVLILVNELNMRWEYRQNYWVKNNISKTGHKIKIKNINKGSDKKKGTLKNFKQWN